MCVCERGGGGHTFAQDGRVREQQLFFRRDEHPLREAHAAVQRYWSRGSAERIWGEFFILVRRSLGKLPANFDSEF